MFLFVKRPQCTQRITTFTKQYREILTLTLFQGLRKSHLNSSQSLQAGLKYQRPFRPMLHYNRAYKNLGKGITSVTNNTLRPQNRCLLGKMLQNQACVKISAGSSIKITAAKAVDVISQAVALV